MAPLQKIPQPRLTAAKAIGNRTHNVAVSTGKRTKQEAESVSRPNKRIKASEPEVNVANVVFHESNGLSLEEDNKRLRVVRQKILKSNRKRKRTGDIPALHHDSVVVKAHTAEGSTRNTELDFETVEHPTLTEAHDPRQADQSSGRHQYEAYQASTQPSSGSLPGKPGYGYDRTGVPLGASYILYMRGHKASGTAVADIAPVGDADEEASVVEELVRGGWTDPGEVTRTQRGGQQYKSEGFTIADAANHNRERERVELDVVQRFNPEFEL